MRRMKYQGIITAAASDSIQTVKVKIQYTITKGLYSMYADEDKNGYHVGDPLGRIGTERLKRLKAKTDLFFHL
jgi:hypothetical protein